MSSSSFGTLLGREDSNPMKLRLHYGGRFVKMQGADGRPGADKYVGGQVFNESVPRSYKYADLCRHLNDKLADTVSIKYQTPGEELDRDQLIVVTDDSDFDEMVGEYDKAAVNSISGRTFRVRVFVFPALQEEREVCDDDEEEVQVQLQLQPPFDSNAYNPDDWCAPEGQEPDEATEYSESSTGQSVVRSSEPEAASWPVGFPYFPSGSHAQYGADQLALLVHTPSGIESMAMGNLARTAGQYDYAGPVGDMGGHGGFANDARVSGASVPGLHGHVGGAHGLHNRALPAMTALPTAVGGGYEELNDPYCEAHRPGGYSQSADGGNGMGDASAVHFGAGMGVGAAASKYGRAPGATGFVGGGGGFDRLGGHFDPLGGIFLGAPSRVSAGGNGFGLIADTAAAARSNTTGFGYGLHHEVSYADTDGAYGTAAAAFGGGISGQTGGGRNGGSPAELLAGQLRDSPIAAAAGLAVVGGLAEGATGLVGVAGGAGGTYGLAQELGRAGVVRAVVGGGGGGMNGWTPVQGPSAIPPHIASAIPPRVAAGVSDGVSRLPSHISAFGDGSIGGLDFDVGDGDPSLRLPSYISAFGSVGNASDGGGGGPGTTPPGRGARPPLHGYAGNGHGGGNNYGLGTWGLTESAVTTPGAKGPDGTSKFVTQEWAVNPAFASPMPHGALPPTLPQLEFGTGRDGTVSRPSTEVSPSSRALQGVVKKRREEVAILRKIGEGAFGEVSEAHVFPYGVVAVKWLKRDRFAKYSESFTREAEVLAKLNHPHIIRMYGLVVEEGAGAAGPTMGGAGDEVIAGIMTECVRSGSLTQHLRALLRPLSLKERCHIAWQATLGMAYLHDQSPAVIHFDLKPDNLLVDGEGDHLVVKVADFGLSKHKFHDHVSCRDLRGTLPYMAPELVSNPNEVSEKCDVWSMGVVMWELATLEVPFQDLSAQSLLMGLMHGSLHLSTPAACEPEWRDLVEQCMEPNPTCRPSFKQLANQLETLLRQLRMEAAAAAAAASSASASGGASGATASASASAPAAAEAADRSVGGNSGAQVNAVGGFAPAQQPAVQGSALNGGAVGNRGGGGAHVMMHGNGIAANGGAGTGGVGHFAPPVAMVAGQGHGYTANGAALAVNIGGGNVYGPHNGFGVGLGVL